MVHLVDATYDGSSLHLDEPLPIEPNTRVRVSVERVLANCSTNEPTSFIETARSLRIDGPSDWSSRVDHYLYGDLGDPDD
ncbi:MAG TPA: hypothetical protein VJT67_13780 [Longimicrobiaceae bacterium]|nr:hypothetical protein [Longimicrobiaceae bacterium]